LAILPFLLFLIGDIIMKFQILKAIENSSTFTITLARLGNGPKSTLWWKLSSSVTGEVYYLPKTDLILEGDVYTLEQAIELATEWDKVELLSIEQTYNSYNGDGGSERYLVTTSHGQTEIGIGYAHNQHNISNMSYDWPVRMIHDFIDNKVNKESLPKKGLLFSMMDLKVNSLKSVDTLKIKKNNIGAGIVDYTYTGPNGVIFLRNRCGLIGNSPSNSSWYRINGGPQQLGLISESEVRAIVA
jgi:hypothetical protein